MEIITKKENTLKSKEDLFNNIKRVIELNKNNMKLQKKLNERFMEKKIDNSTIYSLFRGDIELEQIENDDIRIICLLEGISKEIAPEILYKNKINVNIDDYFTEGEILKYKLYQPPKDEFITSLNLKNVRRINKYEYEVFMSAEYLSKLRKSGLPKYYSEFQRPLKIVVSKNGEIKKKKSMDKENLKELTNRFMGLDIDGNPLKGESYDIITTDIYMFSIWEDGREPFFVWEGDNEPNSIGTLDITPVFDYTSENYSPLIIPDGFHRLTAICDAFDIMESKGEYLDKGFIVHLVLCKIPRTNQFITDVFKRTDIQKDVKEAVSKNPLNDALDSIIENCYVLKGNVANTYEDCKMLKLLTYRNVLLKSLRLTKIDFSRKFMVSSKMSKIGEIISYMFEKFENSEEVKKDSLLYSSGIFAGYIAIGNTILEESNKVDYSILSKICNSLIKMGSENIFDDYGVEGKHVKVKELYNLLETVTMEVVNNAKN